MTKLIMASQLFLPKDIIIDMLSYLPVKSLVRFKCVCKHWNSITLDFQFMCLHFDRSPMLIHKEPHDESNEFEILLSRRCLLLDRTTGDMFPHIVRYRIRNPDLHQIVELPYSTTGLVLNMHIVLDPDNQVLKLLAALFGHPSVLNYAVIDLRNDEENSPYSWRPLKNLSCRGETRLCDPDMGHTILRDAMGTAYCVRDILAGSHIGIDILDMVNDSYIGYTTLPKDFYSKDDCVVWNGKLSFAKIVNDEELHVLVLDDYKKQKWALGKLIIKLTFMNKGDALREKITFISVRKSVLYFRWWDKESICAYDITTGKLTTILSGYSKQDIVITPCLFNLKGSGRFVPQMFSNEDISLLQSYWLEVMELDTSLDKYR